MPISITSTQCYSFQCRKIDSSHCSDNANVVRNTIHNHWSVVRSSDEMNLLFVYFEAENSNSLISKRKSEIGLTIIHYLLMMATKISCFSQKTELKIFVFSEQMISLRSSHLPITVFGAIRTMKEFLGVFLVIVPLVVSSADSIEISKNCSTHETCTECVSSKPSCNWCLRSHRCVEYAKVQLT